MNQISCIDVGGRLWRYVDRELPAADLAAITDHIGRCEGCRALYHEKARESNQYRDAFLGAPFGERFAAELLARMRAESLIESEARTRGSLRGGRFRVLVGLAALILLIPVLVAVIILGLRPRPAGSFEVLGAPVRIGRLVRDGSYDLREVGASRGWFFPGSAFGVPESSVLVLRPGLTSSGAGTSPAGGETSCELTGNAFFSVHPRADRKSFRIFLQVGSLDARVRKLPADETFEVETPHAVATVVGTAFRVVVHGDRTVLAVQEGTVRVEAAKSPGASGPPGAVGPDGPGLVLAEAGETWQVRPGCAPGKLPSADGGETASIGGPETALAQPDGSDLPSPAGTRSGPPGGGAPAGGAAGPSPGSSTTGGRGRDFLGDLDAPVSGRPEPDGAD